MIKKKGGECDMSECIKPVVMPEDELPTYGITWHNSDILTELEFAADAVGVVVAIVAPD